MSPRATRDRLVQRAARRSARHSDSNARHSDFPAVLAAWITGHDSLLDALLVLRRDGARSKEAVDAISSLREVAVLRDSWLLWEALTEGDGHDPEVALLAVVPPTALEQARRALWGPRWDEGVVSTAPDCDPRSRLRVL